MKLIVPTAVVLVTASFITLTTSACSSSTASTGAGDGTGTTLADGGTGPNGATTPGASAQSFEVRLATAECAAEERCGADWFAGYYANQADCVAHVSASYTGSLHAASTAIMDAQITACAAATGNRSCSDVAASTSCNFTGTVENGAACTYASQCKSGSCYFATSTVCGGVCKDRVALGGDCSAAYCDVSTTFCGSTKKCEALPKEGESCATFYRCEAALQCDFASNTCRKVTPLGGDCSSATGNPCDLTLDCIDDKCVAQTKVAVGAACGTDDAGKTTVCLQSQCTGTDDNGANGKCTPYPALGAACDSTKFIGCDATASCVSGTCKLSKDVHACK